MPRKKRKAALKRSSKKKSVQKPAARPARRAPQRKRASAAHGELHVEISIKEQMLRLMSGRKVVMSCAVSTARNGAGEKMNSGCTPRGRHVVAEKIGAGAPVNTVFVGRRPTGEIYSMAMRARHPGRDWILTRILWLRGMEPGVNRGGDVDTYNRYIYIHGSPDDVAMGKPGSAGCIRMRNRDVGRLFESVTVGTAVVITG